MKLFIKILQVIVFALGGVGLFTFGAIAVVILNDGYNTTLAEVVPPLLATFFGGLVACGLVEYFSTRKKEKKPASNIAC